MSATKQPLSFWVPVARPYTRVKIKPVIKHGNEKQQYKRKPKHTQKELQND